jgi:glycosyltransferase involved in cell wall biosynthesis
VSTQVTLVVTSSWPRTGDPIAGTFVRTDAIARARRGERVVVAAPVGPGVARGAEGLHVVDVAHAGLFGSPGGVSRLRRNPLKIVGISRFARDVRRVVELARPTKIVAHWIVPGGAVARIVAPRETSIEIVAHGGDVRMLEALPRSVARAMLETIVGEAQLRAVSGDLAERIATVAPSLARSIVVAPMPLATDDEHVRIEAHRSARELRNDRASPLHVVASRLVASKPIARAVDHVALAGGRLVLLGDGPTRARIVDHATRSRVALDALGARPHEEALAWIAAADVLLAPLARGEGNSTVVREARALGTPVVVLTS